MIHYLVAKYVDDLSRNEPKNVGVVVYDGNGAWALFDGEDENANIDLRRVRNRVTGSHAYRAWVDYWRAVLSDPSVAHPGLSDLATGDARVIEYLVATSGRDFYLEPGGTVLIDAEHRSAIETLDELFGRLVRQPDPSAPPTLKEKSRDALAAAGAPMSDEARFKEDHAVRLSVLGVSVDEEISYAVMNGAWHYLQVMPFSPDKPRVSRKEASHCAFLFEHLPEIKDNGAILYDESDITQGQYRLLEMLMKLAPVVNVNNVDSAAAKLHDHLNLHEARER